jgi:hypothetical protein
MAAPTPEATAAAVRVPLITVINVLPTSPRTIRLAIKGMKAIITARSRLAKLITKT